MASKKLDKLKTAGAGMDKFFSGASEMVYDPEQKPEEGTRTFRVKVSESPKKPRKTNTQPKTQTVSEKPQKVQKKVFSFRAEVDTVDSWRVWADAKGLKVDELGEKAITEYIKKHPLTPDQKKIYELKLAQKKS